MLTIRVTAFDKKDLPKWLAYEIERYHEQGHLTGLIHAKDDVIRETSYGCWEIYSYWGTSEEVDTQNYSSLIEEIEEKLYSSENLRILVTLIWNILSKYNHSDIDFFREDVLNALRGPNVTKNLLCTLIDWSDKLGE